MSKGMRNLIAMNHVCQKLQRQLVIQKDLFNDTRYQSWILNGVGYREGKSLETKGWIWLKGPQGGAWSTMDDDQGVKAELAAQKKNGLEIIRIGNGWNE